MVPLHWSRDGIVHDSSFRSASAKCYSYNVRPRLRQSAEQNSPAQRALFPTRVRTTLVYETARDLLTTQCVESGVADVVSSINIQGGRPFLFAGAVRDAVRSALTSLPGAPRDYDIGVSGMSRNRFGMLCRALGAQPNRHGGYRCCFSKMANMDLWRTEDTVGILVHACAPTISNILRSFILDLNAIAYDPNTGEFHDYGCLAALTMHRIGFVRSALLHDHSDFAGRAISLQVRFGFRMSPPIRSFVAEWHDPKETERQFAKMNTTTLTPPSHQWGRPELQARLPVFGNAATISRTPSPGARTPYSTWGRHIQG